MAVDGYSENLVLVSPPEDSDINLLVAIRFIHLAEEFVPLTDQLADVQVGSGAIE